MKKRLWWESDPIVNHLLGGQAPKPIKNRIFDELRLIHELSDFSPVNFHKQKLGKQSFTEYGEWRSWVWESKRGWRVWASGKGVNFEVRTNSLLREVIAAWDDYIECLGLQNIMICRKVISE